MLPVEDLKQIVQQTESVWEHLRRKRIFLSGGTGFVGSWLIESFLYANKNFALGAELLVLSRSPKAFFEKHPELKNEKSLVFVSGDVRNFENPAGLVHFVIHAATDPSMAASAENSLETMEVIYLGTKRVLELCQQKKIEKYLFVSSGAVYGKQPQTVSHLAEDFQGAPNLQKSSSAYGEGKRVGEWLSHLFGEAHGFEVKVARLFAFVGPYLPLEGHFAVGNFIRQAIAGQDIVVKSDGKSQRSYMYASDMTAWLWQILIHGKSKEAYNVGSEQAVSIRELAQKIISIENPKLKLEVLGKSVQEISGDRYIPSTQKVRNDLKLNIQVDENDALKKTILFYKNLAETK